MCVLFVCHVCRACPTKPSLFIRWSLVHRWNSSIPGQCFLKSARALKQLLKAHPFVVSGERVCQYFDEGMTIREAQLRSGIQNPGWLAQHAIFLFGSLNFEFWVAFALWPFQSFSQACDDFGTSTFGSEFKSAKLHPQTGAPDVKMTSSLRQSRLEKAWRTAIHYSGPGLLHGAGTPAWFLEASKSLDELGFETCSKLIAYLFHFFVSKVGVALVREYCWLGG